MEYEFEGRTQKEAIDIAAHTLGLEKDDFDVEILETQRQGIFKKGFTRIKVHTDKVVTKTDIPYSASSGGEGKLGKPGKPSKPDQNSNEGQFFSDPAQQAEFEKNMIEFIEGIISRMSYQGKVSVMFREGSKIGFRIDSEDSSILIGKKGKNIDALQLIANIYARRYSGDNIRIILDSENYRIRREESVVKLAYSVADKVRESRQSVLLEPMNPYDRRLVHTTLSDIGDVETKSEGDGLYRQVRVYYRGGR